MAGKYLSQQEFLHSETVARVAKASVKTPFYPANVFNETTAHNTVLFDDAHHSARSVALLVDKADPLSKGHSCRVARYSAAIGAEMGMGKDEIEGLRVGGYLHDIGKIFLPAGILDKATLLTIEEYLEVKQHTVLGYEMLRSFDWIYPIEKVAYYHHEYHNGSGYPCGLAGEEIPISARIVAAADAYDAMVSTRGYSRPRTFPEIIGELKMCSGSQFDPSVIDAFLSRILREIEKDILPELTAFVSKDHLCNLSVYTR